MTIRDCPLRRETWSGRMSGIIRQDSLTETPAIARKFSVIEWIFTTTVQIVQIGRLLRPGKFPSRIAFDSHFSLRDWISKSIAGAWFSITSNTDSIPFLYLTSQRARSRHVTRA